jgi:tetratricopeptide (TPR) repeat protein
MAHAVLGNVAFGFDWNLPVAEREFRRAIDLEPNNPSAHEWYGHYLIVAGHEPEAMTEMNHALELDPVSPLFNTVRAETFYYARQYDQAIEQARRTLEAYPNFWLTHFWLGSAYREKKMYPQAVEQFRLARELSHDLPAMIMAYGHAQALAANPAEARRALATLKELSRSRYIPALYFAGIHLGLGEKDQTVAELTQAYTEKTDRLIYLGVEPIADPLRSDPRFRALLRQIGLPERGGELPTTATSPSHN